MKSVQAIKKHVFSRRFLIVAIPVFLSLIGLIFVFEASSIRSLSETGESFSYLKLQVRWIIMGYFAMIITSLFPYKKLYYLGIPLLGMVIILLLAVLLPQIGKSAGGSRSWIDLGFINIQPTEFAKVALIIYLSSWFSKKDKNLFLPFITLMGIIILLVMLQPDLGAVVILFSLAIAIYYLAGQNLKYLLLLAPISVVGFFILVYAAPYRIKRLTAFLNPGIDPMGVGYHINQILISLSNGGIFGQGLGASRQKYLFLPEAHTDSIFAIFGEEFGFVGSLILIVIYLVFLYLLFNVYKSVNNTFGKLLVGGVFAFFGLQIIINLGGMVGLMPLTGVPLPFISYGGSHMLTSFILIGIVLNITRSQAVLK